MSEDFNRRMMWEIRDSDLCGDLDIIVDDDGDIRITSVQNSERFIYISQENIHALSDELKKLNESED